MQNKSISYDLDDRLPRENDYEHVLQVFLPMQTAISFISNTRVGGVVE